MEKIEKRLGLALKDLAKENPAVAKIVWGHCTPSGILSRKNWGKCCNEPEKPTSSLCGHGFDLFPSQHGTCNGE
ncbi:MAG: hypothetical protein AAF483_26355, partial [Planctomycetota bacterium]